MGLGRPRARRRDLPRPPNEARRPAAPHHAARPQQQSRPQRRPRRCPPRHLRPRRKCQPDIHRDRDRRADLDPIRDAQRDTNPHVRARRSAHALPTDGGDVNIGLGGLLAAGGFYLLEHTDDQAVADIPAGQIYTGGLNNAGGTLRLLNPTGALVDSANGDRAGWLAGSGGSHASMERRSGDDRSRNWARSQGITALAMTPTGIRLRAPRARSTRCSSQLRSQPGPPAGLLSTRC
jgi:hypothetical protein